MQTSPTLDTLLSERAEQLRPFFKPNVLSRPGATFSFEFDEGQPFYLEVDGDNFDFKSGRAESPTIRLFVSDHATCWQLLTGSTDSMDAFMKGKYRADGNIVLSQLLLYLFYNDDPTIAYEVKD